MPAKDHKIIKALKYADCHPNGFTQEELANHLGISTNDFGVLHDCFHQEKGLFKQIKFKNQSHSHEMTEAGVRMLYQVEESRSAKVYSRWALAIALISLLLSAGSTWRWW